jgi:hypothetical protein
VAPRNSRRVTVRTIGTYILTLRLDASQSSGKQFVRFFPNHL